MYKFEINPNTEEKPLRMQETKIGDLMEIIESNHRYNGAIALRVHQGFVILDKPVTTICTDGMLLVKLLPKGTVITLTVE
jgi:hypothetical protein